MGTEHDERVMTENTTAVVAGGGPAGMMLGLLLARAGVEVTVLEKHADFLRDFRGDTIHSSTLELIEELGLTERFQRIPQGKMQNFAMGEVSLGSLTELNLKYPYIAIAPQWDFLSMLAEEAQRYPHFRLLMQTEVIDTISEDGLIVGVRYRDSEGQEHELRAPLTVAADGRHSTIRAASGLTTEETGSPFDTVWFRLSKQPTDSIELYFRISPHRWIVGFDRRTYLQIAYMIPKGSYAALQEAGIDAIRHGVAETVPELADRVGELKSFDDTSMLEVRVNRAPRWHLPGLLLIGDAAHAMSPIGGVGVKLAIDDAVATANILSAPLLRVQREGILLPEKLLAAVQQRRKLPTVVTQTFQRVAYERLVAPAFKGKVSSMPTAAKAALRIPALRHRILRTMSVGIRQEHIQIPAAQS